MNFIHKINQNFFHLNPWIPFSTHFRRPSSSPKSFTSSSLSSPLDHSLIFLRTCFTTVHRPTLSSICMLSFNDSLWRISLNNGMQPFMRFYSNWTRILKLHILSYANDTFHIIGLPPPQPPSNTLSSSAVWLSMYLNPLVLHYILISIFPNSSKKSVSSYNHGTYRSRTTSRWNGSMPSPAFT